MMEVSVSFTFEAESMEEAQRLVSTWTVHPGVKLFGMQGTEQGIKYPVEMPMGGTIGGALLVTAQQAAIPMPPDVVPSPGGPYDHGRNPLAEPLPAKEE